MDFWKKAFQKEIGFLYQISQGNALAEEAWQALENNWLPNFIAEAISEGFNRETIRKGFFLLKGRVDDDIKKREENKWNYLKTDDALLDFFKQCLFDFLIHDNCEKETGEVAQKFIERKWKTKHLNRLADGKTLTSEEQDKIFEGAMAFFKRNIVQHRFNLDLKWRLEGVFFDELLLSGIRHGDRSRNIACAYILTHWSQALIRSDNPQDSERRKEFLNYSIAKMVNQVVSPQKDQPFYLTKSLIGYVRQIIKAELIKNAEMEKRQEKIKILTNSIIEPYKAQKFSPIQEQIDNLNLTDNEISSLKSHMGKTCSEILRMDFEHQSDGQIRDKKGWKSVQSVRNRRNKCYKKIRDFIIQQRTQQP